MKQMKFIMIMLCSIILLSGCNKKEEVKENTNIKEEEVKEETKNENTNPPGTVGTIIQSKKAIAKDSAYGFIDAIEQYIILTQLSTEYDASVIPVDGTTCKKVSGVWNGNRCAEFVAVIKVKGSQPEDGSLFVLKDGTVTSATLVFSGYTTTYDGLNVNVE